MLKINNQNFNKVEADSSRAIYDYLGEKLLPEQLAVKFYENLGYRALWGKWMDAIRKLVNNSQSLTFKTI